MLIKTTTRPAAQTPARTTSDKKIGTQEYPANPALDTWAGTSDIHSKPEFFRMAAKKNPDGEYLGGKVDKEYQFQTYRQAEQKVEQFASGLMDLGLQPGERIGIFAQSSPDWRVADFGASYAGSVVVGMVAELPDDRVEFVLKDSDSKLVMVDTKERLEQVLKAEKNLPNLKTIVVAGDLDLSLFEGRTSRKLMTLNQLLEDGKKNLDGNRAGMENRIDGIRYDDIASMVYTSGSTGTPKGVLLSHGNVLSAVEGTLQKVNNNPKETLSSANTRDVYPSVLPQGHVMGQVGDLAVTASGGKIVYPPSLAAFTKDLRDIQPTVLAVTPLFLHKIHDGIESKALKQDKPVVSPFLAGLAAGSAGAALGGTVGAMVGAGIGGPALQWGLGLAGAALAGGLADHAASKFATKMTGAEAYKSAVRASEAFYSAHGNHTVMQRVKHELAKKLVFSKARDQVDKRLGGKTRAILSGGAPLSSEAETVIRGMGIGVAQGYGLTETSGAGITNSLGGAALGTAGSAQKSAQARIGDGGELQLRGPSIMTGGYLNRPDKTSETFTEDGWFKTGDTATVIKTRGPFSAGKFAAVAAAGTGVGAVIGQAVGSPGLGALLGGAVSGLATIATGAARTAGEDHYQITGRIKSQFKLPGGEYVTPEPIESALQSSPFISRALVTGAKDKDLLGALVQPNFDNLAEWAAARGISTEPAEMVKNPEVIKLLEDQASNLSSTFRKHEVVRRLHILEHELSGDEITSKGEIMRKIVSDKYASEIERMFQ